MIAAVLPSGCTCQDIATQLDGLLQAYGFPAGAVSNPLLGDKGLSIDVRGSGTTWTIQVDTRFRVPGRLPVVRLVAPLQLLAHVAHYQEICIDDGQGLSIDVERPANVLAQVLCDAVRVLEDAAIDAQAGYPRLLDEFEGYFAEIPHGTVAASSVEVDAKSRLIYAHVENSAKANQVCKYYSEREGSPPAEFRTSNLPTVTALYFALDCNVLPPSPSTELDTTFIDRLVSAFGPEERQLWDSLSLKRRSRGQCPGHILVSQPRPAGGRSLIGLTFTFREGQLDPTRRVSHLTVRRHTTEYMRERGGASNSLSAKHVAILGCGSVGSELADALATSGVGKMTLVDFDNFEVENVFRHALGKDATGSKKVDALKLELARKYPGIDVVAIAGNASEWLGTAAARQVDTIVLAIGNPACERELCRQIRTLGLRCCVVLTWLEALGLGGHVVAVENTGEGCLECLYRDDEGRESLYPVVSFLAPGQVVSRTLSGCVGAFIPYSAINSRKTALLAAETVLKSFSGSIAPRYEYWAGDDTQASALGFGTSAWFKRARTVDAATATRVIFEVPCRYCRQEVRP